MNPRWFRVCSRLLALILILSGLAGPVPARAATVFIDVPGPANSGSFGKTVTLLPNGNFVVTDPNYPFYIDYTEARGAVYLYNPDGVLISRLIGGKIGNSVGSGGITVLANGSYVVNSPFWDSATTDGVGAVTWCSQTAGCSGTVSAANSLVGSHSADLVGYGGITALANGSYVVSSPRWAAGGVLYAGAVTWGSGAGGTTGEVSAANSLVGSTYNDQFGGSVLALANGSYVVVEPGWDHAAVADAGAIVDAGAVAWGSGAGGTSGVISPANSLVGSRPGDGVGKKVIGLANGSYVVISPSWDLDDTRKDVWAITWGSDAQGISGAVSPANSLVGVSQQAHLGYSTAGDYGVTALPNGNYVVASEYWSPDGTNAGWGAVTWGSGTAGVSGQISAANSLVGSAPGDGVGMGNFFHKQGVVPLTNGNYVITSSNWNSQGAVTWANGMTGITGTISAANSLVGYPSEVIALANGNYAVSGAGYFDSPSGPVYHDAITWGNGTTGTSGPVSAANSLVGSSTYDSLGEGGLVALTNGNFVVVSTGLPGGGGVTWVSGSHVTTGEISAGNSLVGSKADDQVGGGMYSEGVKPLANGNYVVCSPHWDNGGIVDAGAITWGDGASGTTGVVSAANSLVGTSADDQLGGTWWYHGGVTTLAGGAYVVFAPQWDRGGIVDAGAATWGSGSGGTAGPVSEANSLVGSATDDLKIPAIHGGEYGVVPLTNGDYLVSSPHWNSTGAITWANGTTGTAGAISPANSLVNGCAADPNSCKAVVSALPGGSAAVIYPLWAGGGKYGAAGLVNGPPEITAGPISGADFVLGSTSGKAGLITFTYDAARAQLIVALPGDNRVAILRHRPPPSHWVYLPGVIQ